MKRIISLFVCILITVTMFTCCSDGRTNDKRLSVVTTIFPIYDWVNNIIGEMKDSIDLTLLLDSGVDLHSYQPTASDIVKIAGCDVLIYVGGESDEWVNDVLAESTNRDMIVLDLLEMLGDLAKEEEIKEGMAAEDGEENGEIEYDEHIWLSLKNSCVLCRVIADALADADKDNAEIYSKNADAYISELGTLDEKYTETVLSAENKTLVFGDRFPFRYLTDDYGIDYYAAFAGCSAESEASFEIIIFLASKLDELDLDYVIKLEGSDGKIADTVCANTKTKSQTVLSMNSLQSVTKKDADSGVSYLSVMEENLAVLKTALNR